MLHEIGKELSPLYGEKNIALPYDLQPVTLNGNPVLLYRAFFNLVENALKYTGDRGAVTVTVRINDKDFVICIANTGGAGGSGSRRMYARPPVEGPHDCAAPQAIWQRRPAEKANHIN